MGGWVWVGGCGCGSGCIFAVAVNRGCLIRAYAAHAESENLARNTASELCLVNRR